ncbi:MAG: translation initiation factor IF-2 [Myxococcales bacterium]|nr:translation initiation factor IF-2 [Myxococcales bacterium]
MNNEVVTGQGPAATPAGKVRIYELAKDLGVQPTDLVSRIRSLGIEVKNHMSNLEGEDVARIKRALDKERQENLIEERLTPTVIRRRTKDGTAVRAVAPPPGVASPSAPKPFTVAAQAPRTTAKVEDDAGEPHAHPALRQTHGDDEPHREAQTHDAPVSVQPSTPERAPADETPPTEPPKKPLHPAIVRQAPAAPRTDPQQAEPSVPVAAAPPPGPAPMPVGPKKEEPIKYGPTGRVIDLPNLRQPIIQVTERPAGPAGRNVRDLSQKRDMSGRDRFGRQQHGKKKAQAGKKQKATQITTPAAHKRVVKMDDTIAVAEAAKQMGLKATDVLKKLWSLGMTGITLNSAIDQDAATLVAQEFGYEIQSEAFVEADVFEDGDDNPDDLVGRAPVVTIMGHVDHGKTSLLDAIRDANVAAGEAGGITQHIGAYKVQTPSGQEVVFLDTPGHEAFTAMRARGAQATDIVVLVVAADDGVMPQTVEAVQHAKDAEVPIVVVVNKIDKVGAQPDRIRQQLSDYGLVPEAWGGETIYVDVSARTRVGIDTLLEMLALQSEVLELQANPNKLSRGVVIEAKLDRNRGPVATVLVQDGTLKTGDTVVAGEQIGKVRAMLDDKGRNVTAAVPSTPVEVLGLSGVPNAGETFNAVADEKSAKELVEHRRDQRRKKELAGTSKVTLENILDKIRAGVVKELKIVLKADVQGSAEAIKDALIKQSNEQVKVDVISSGVGGITESDVNLAKAGNAIIVGFHVRPAGKAQQLAEQESVDIKLYNIIYEALDDVRKAMVGLLAPVKREKPLGKAEVRQTFTIPKLGMIAGCGVTEGIIKRSAQLRVVRDAVQVFIGKVSSLRRFKDDVKEVAQGYECGIGIDGYNDLKEGDIIEAYEIEEIAATLL